MSRDTTPEPIPPADLRPGMIVYDEPDLGNFGGPEEVVGIDTALVVVSTRGGLYSVYLTDGHVADEKMYIRRLAGDGRLEVDRTQAEAVLAAVASDRQYYANRLAVVDAAERWAAEQKGD
jgi:hypothetical protein